MKATLTFNLSDLEDRDAFNRAVAADKMCSALWDIQQVWRKFKHMEMTDDFYDGTEAVLKAIREILEEHDVNPEILMR